MPFVVSTSVPLTERLLVFHISPGGKVGKLMMLLKLPAYAGAVNRVKVSPAVRILVLILVRISVPAKVSGLPVTTSPLLPGVPPLFNAICRVPPRVALVAVRVLAPLKLNILPAAALSEATVWLKPFTIRVAPVEMLMAALAPMQLSAPQVMLPA